jgi:hypothetical protein
LGNEEIRIIRGFLSENSSSTGREEMFCDLSGLGWIGDVQAWTPICPSPEKSQNGFLETLEKYKDSKGRSLFLQINRNTVAGFLVGPAPEV